MRVCAHEQQDGFYRQWDQFRDKSLQAVGSVPLQPGGPGTCVARDTAVPSAARGWGLMAWSQAGPSFILRAQLYLFHHRDLSLACLPLQRVAQALACCPSPVVRVSMAHMKECMIRSM